jgi:hypothetical protein
MPIAPLKPGTEYRVVLDRIVDHSGNVMAGSHTLRFSTGQAVDLNPPRATTPNRVAPGEPIRVRFSEPMDFTSIQDTRATVLSGSDRGTSGTWFSIWPVRLEPSADRRELAIVPLRPLVLGESYTLSVNPAADRAGNRVQFETGSVRVTVTDQPPPAPVTLQLFPADGDTGIPTNVVISATPSRVVSSLSITVFEGDRPVGVIGGSGRIALNPNTRYRIEAVGADFSGAPIAPASSSFTTGAGPIQSATLQLTEALPANGAANVSPDTPITLRFNRDLHPGAAYTGVRVTSDIFIPPPVVAARGPVLTIAPAVYWPPASFVQLSVSRQTSGVALPGPIDIAGNPYNTFFGLQFRTGALADPTPAALEEVLPPPGSELPALEGATVSLRFSRPVIIPGDGFRVFINGQPSQSGCLIPVDEPRVCRVVMRLPAKAEITIVGTNAIRDYAGNNLAPFVLEYRAGETIPAGPISAQLLEPRGSMGETSTNPVVAFDRPMNVETVLGGMQVTQDLDVMPGTIEPQSGGAQYRFRPARPFAAGSQIRIILPLSIRDLAGRTLPDWLILPFQISRAANAPARTLQLTRASVTPALPANAPLDVVFNTGLLPGSVHGETVWLSAGQRLVPARVEQPSPDTIRLTPLEALTPGQQYVATFGAALRGLEGQPFAGASVVFTAGPAAEPALVGREEIQWHGRTARRLRFSDPLTAAEAAAFRGDGEALLSTDGLTLILTQPGGDALKLGEPAAPRRHKGSR